MLKKIISFIKYNTFTAIIATVAFVAVASAVASNEGVKNKIIGEEIVEKSGVDNSALLAADLENFDLAMEITNVAEDMEEAKLPIGDLASDEKPIETGKYYIDYQYNTLGIQDDVWQKILRQKRMTVSKAALGGGDLGLYVSEELGEIIDNEIAYLKEVQKNEEEKGQTYITEKTEYSGLIGLVLNTKTKELPGYEPVVKPPKPVENLNAQIPNPSQIPNSNDQILISTPSVEPTPAPTAEPTPTPEPTPASTPTATPAITPTP